MPGLKKYSDRTGDVSHMLFFFSSGSIIPSLSRGSYPSLNILSPQVMLCSITVKYKSARK